MVASNEIRPQEGSKQNDRHGIYKQKAVFDLLGLDIGYEFGLK